MSQHIKPHVNIIMMWISFTEKIKFLLEELWQCIENSTGKKQINKCEHALGEIK